MIATAVLLAASPWQRAMVASTGSKHPVRHDRDTQDGRYPLMLEESFAHEQDAKCCHHTTPHAVECEGAICWVTGRHQYFLGRGGISAASIGSNSNFGS